MRIGIVYFSGTGNTCYIAGNIAGVLAGRGHDVTLCPAEKASPGQSGEWDALIFGFPVYACDMPAFLTDYIASMAVPKTRAVVLFATMALYAGNAARRVMKRFLDRGMIPLHFEAVRLPGSDGLAFMGRHSCYVRKITRTDYGSSPAIAEAVNRIADAVESAPDGRPAAIPGTSVAGLLAGSLMGLVYGSVERFMKKRFRADDGCIRCGRCQRMCPVQNITVEPGGVIFHDRCVLCMRCLHQCPSEALQIGTLTRGKFRWKGPAGGFDPLK